MTDLAPDAPAQNRGRTFLKHLLKRRMVAIGLAILVVLFRNRATINVAEIDSMKG